MTTDRRRFIKTGTATGLIAAAPHIARAENGDSNTIKIGIIGCGGRGTGAVNQALNADANVRLWAMADAFPEKVERALADLSANPAYAGRIDAPKERRFDGIDAYQQLIDSGVDVVLIATPPGFRPQHLRAAIEAGKHVFAEKPMAVDMAGIHSVLQSAKLADKKKLTIQHGYCWRYKPEAGVEQDMSQACHNELFAALRAGKHINAGVYMANSTALGLLGLEAAHTGQRVTWDQLMASGRDLAPDDLKINDSFDYAPLPMAGRTKFA